MRFFLAFIVGAGGLLTLCVGDGRAQPSTHDFRDGDLQQFLTGPSQSRRSQDDVRNLSAPPRTQPLTPESLLGPSRDSLHDRQEQRDAVPAPSLRSRE